MSRYNFECSAVQTNEEIPAELVARLPPNYTIHYFYIRLVVVVQQPLSFQEGGGPVLILGHQFELLAPHDEPIGVSGLSWNAIISFLNQNGIPVNIVDEVAMRITNCISQMLENPNNAGRMLLSMLVLISCRVSVRAQRFLTRVVPEAICAICMDHMELGSPASARLPCNHSYHDGCISEWLSNDPSCPLCRSQSV